MTGDKSRTSIFRHRTGRLSMICVDGNWRIAAAALLLATGGSAMAGSLGGPLELQDEGSFFVNGQPTQSTHPGTAVGGISQPGTITVNQMYVQYRIPKTVSGPAIVMVHGSGHTGATYETTPDGREGWATYFARKGFPVYVVDHSGRGRSGFNPTVINRARRSQCRASSRHPDRAARARLVFLPHRRDLSDALPRRAVSDRGVRPVHRAARAQRGGDAARRRRQYRAGARRAARQDRARGRDGAFAIRRLRHGPGARPRRQDVGLHQYRGQLRAGDAG